MASLRKWGPALLVLGAIGAGVWLLTRKAEGDEGGGDKGTTYPAPTPTSKPTVSTAKITDALMKVASEVESVYTYIANLNAQAASEGWSSDARWYLMEFWLRRYGFL